MRKLILFAGVLTGSAASAQTFTVNDTSYTGLSSSYYVMDSNAVSHSAITGTGVTWNYASLWAYEDNTIPDAIIDASASPNASDFPTAVYNDDLSSGTSVFFSNSADSITVHGFVVAADGIEVIVKHESNPLKMMVFPGAVGSTYNDVIAGEIEVTGYPALPSSGNATVTVDGFGTLNVSGNTHANILRVKLVESITGTLTFPPASGTVTRTVYYYYDFANDKQPVLVHANIAVASDVLNDNYTAVYYSGTPNHFLTVQEPAISTAAIYPNPANNVVTIANDGNLDVLSVINSLGQVVLTISSPQAQEMINVADFEPGVYIVQMTKGTAVSEQKLIVE